MKKLQNKVFFMAFFALSISVIIVLIFYNTQKYFDAKDKIEKALTFNINSKNISEMPIKEDELEKKNDTNNENIKYMDQVVYEVILSDENTIVDIINHSSKNESSNINKVANNILKSNKDKHIGFLYTERYSYKYLNNNTIIITDNLIVKNSLLSSLKISIFFLLIFELIIYIISKYLTIWITKPVKETFDKQKQFIADASHELKTPLSVIIASSEALENNINEKKWLNNIQSEAVRMNDLITSLLDLAKSEHSEVLPKKIGDLSSIVELSILTFEPIAYENSNKLKYDIEDNIKFNMNENSIKQLVEILLDNAIKHADKKSIIFISLKKEENAIVLTCENKGNPIIKGDEEKIFERFYRADKSRNRDDNRYGLGLAIAKNIVENHSGKITASSKDGKTTFKVIFKKE